MMMLTWIFLEIYLKKKKSLTYLPSYLQMKNLVYEYIITIFPAE